MIQQNNMDIIAKSLVDNVMKNAIEEVKNEKANEKNYNRFIKIFFEVRQKLEDLNALQKKLQ